MIKLAKQTGILFIVLICCAGSASAQSYIIDRVVAVIGDFQILQSDIEQTYLQYKAQGAASKSDMKCEILEELMAQKLLLDQAKIDSIEIPESQVEMQLNQRLDYFIAMIGSQEDLEKYFGKTILEIKEDMRESVRELSLTDQMQNKITSDVRVTPSEVKSLYKSLPADSVPFVESEMETSQIVKYPPVDDNAIFDVKQRLLELRKRVINGEKFSTLAVLYSEDASASKGGEIGFSGKAELDPEYAKAAFSLKEGGISTIVESSFGFHLIQLIERREDRVNTRHILMKPKVDKETSFKTKQKLDSIARVIRLDSLTFSMAARVYSEDRNTAFNGGVMVNPENNTVRYRIEQLPTADYVALRDLQIGEITVPFESKDEKGKQVFKIMKIDLRTNPHRANLKDDYLILQNMALNKKKVEAIEEWMVEKIGKTYFYIDESYGGCKFHLPDWNK